MVEESSDSEVTTATMRHNEVHLEPRPARLVAKHPHFSQHDLLERMSHEMRTPLSAILGFAQLMDSGQPSPSVSQKKCIDLILQSGWYLDRLINMTRDIALANSGRLSLSVDAVPLAGVMRDCQAMIEAQARMRGVRVVFPLLDTPCFVSADAHRLQQVLTSLLSVAIECSESDGAIVMDCEARPDRIRIGFTVCGEGSSMERLRRIFQSFDRPPQDATRGEDMGISLLLARRLIELMGGAIGADLPVGTSKVFSFDLNRTVPATAADRNPDHPESDEATIITFNAAEQSAANIIRG